VVLLALLAVPQAEEVYLQLVVQVEVVYQLLADLVEEVYLLLVVQVEEVYQLLADLVAEVYLL
jgi:hypothetical protein